MLMLILFNCEIIIEVFGKIFLFGHIQIDSSLLLLSVEMCVFFILFIGYLPLHVSL